MAENLFISPDADKEQKYRELIPQIKILTEGESNQIANLANVAAALKSVFSFFWVGFYLVENEELILGPFQGPIACTRIKKGKGVCGSCWANEKTIIVPDVDAFPGHIACSSASKSEIVVPVYANDKSFVGVLDIDSDEINEFDEIDQQYLELLLQQINIQNDKK